MNAITIQFKDADDADNFAKFVKQAKEGEGTPRPLWCALAASACKRAAIIDNAELAALREVAEKAKAFSEAQNNFDETLSQPFAIVAQAKHGELESALAKLAAVKGGQQ